MDEAKLHFWQQPPCTYHRSAQLEFFLTIVISILPLIVTFFGYWIRQEESAIIAALSFVTGEGQLIIYAATLLAPVIYTTQKDPPVKGKNWFFLVSLVLLFISVTYQLVYAMGEVKQHVSLVSAIFASIAVILFYLSLYFEHRARMAPSAPEAHSQANENFATNFKQYMAEQDNAQE